MKDFADLFEPGDSPDREMILDEGGRVWTRRRLASVYQAYLAASRRSIKRVLVISHQPGRTVEGYLMLLAALSAGKQVFLGGRPSRQERERLRGFASAFLALRSSGTVSNPNWVVHRPESLFHDIRRVKKEAHPVLIVLHPMHAAGIDHFFRALSVGRFIVLGYGLKTSALRARCARRSVRELISTPTFVGHLFFDDGFAGIFRRGMLRLGCEPVSREFVLALRQRFPGIRIAQFFGSTETWGVPTRTQTEKPWLIRLGNKNIKVEADKKSILVHSPRNMLVEKNGIWVRQEAVRLHDQFECREEFWSFLGRSDSRAKVGGRWICRKAIANWTARFPEVSGYVFKEKKSRALGLRYVELCLLTSSATRAKALRRLLEEGPEMNPPARGVTVSVQVVRHGSSPLLRRGKLGEVLR